jgi:hypothetical protein
MQAFNGANQMLSQWIKTEHHRLHCVERWPDSPYKEVVLAAIHSVLERLKAALPAPMEPPQCMVCASRRAESVLEFPDGSQDCPVVRLAA